MSYDHWMTDPVWIERIRACMGSIDFDPASNAPSQEYVKAGGWAVAPEEWNSVRNDYYNVCKDGLSFSWDGNVYCNPPYSAGNIDLFVNKAIYEWQQVNTNQLCMLVNSATDTKWHQKLLTHCTGALLVRGRIKFWKVFDGKAHATWEGQVSKEKGLGKVGNSPRYLNTLFYFGDSITPFVNTFKPYGTIVVRSI